MRLADCGMGLATALLLCSPLQRVGLRVLSVLLAAVTFVVLVTGDAAAQELYSGGNLVPGTHYEHVGYSVQQADRPNTYLQEGESRIELQGDVAFNGDGEVTMTTSFGVSIENGSLTLDAGDTLHIKNLNRVKYLDGRIEERATAAGSNIHFKDSVFDINGGKLYLYGSPNGFSFMRRGEVLVRNGGEVIFESYGDRPGIMSLSGGAGASDGDLVMTIEKGSLFRGSYTVGTGGGAHLIADHSLETKLVSISMGGVFEEKSAITIDGKGGTVSTRMAVTSYPGNEYYGPGRYIGDLIVNVADDADEDAELTIGGVHQGNVQLKKGTLYFWRGGKLEGDLTVSGGNMELLIPRDHETPDISSMISGAFIFDGGGDFTFQEDLSLYVDEDLVIRAGNFNAAGADVGTAKNLNISGGSLSAGTLTAAALNMSEGVLAARQLSVSGATEVSGSGSSFSLLGDGAAGAQSTVGGLTVHNGAAADINCLQVASGSKVQVGMDTDSVGGTTLSAGHLDLNGGALLIDPAWGLEPSNVAVENLSSAHSVADSVSINGNVGVGQNSYLAVGTRDTGWLPDLVQQGTDGVGLSQGGVESALGLHKPVTIENGKSVLVDGSMNSSQLESTLSSGLVDTATFAPNSLLVLNGADAQLRAGTPAISFAAAGGSVEVDDNAKLMIAGAVDGVSYNVSNAPVTRNGNAWEGANLLSSSPMISLESSGGGSVFVARINSPTNVYPDLSAGMGQALSTLYTGNDGLSLADVDSPSAGVRFLSRASDARYQPIENTAKTIEGAARMPFAGAVPQMSKLAADSMSQTMQRRIGTAALAEMAAISQADPQSNTGLAVWATPVYQNMSAENLAADKLDYGYRADLGGLVLGADYTFDNNLRAGVSISAGGGYAKSKGDFNSTSNSMDFWGLGVYLGWSRSNFALLFDTAYTATSNELEQSLEPGMDMGGKLKADVRADVYQAGLQAEYKIETPVVDITPHAGARYMHIKTNNYDVKADDTVLYGHESSRDVWTFPAGITFSKDIVSESGWVLSPYLDVAVVPAAGDLKATDTVAITGLPGIYSLETEIADDLTWQGRAGVELGKDNLALSLDYTLQAGKHSTGHGVSAMISYEF